MEMTSSVGRNPKESSSMTASTISGYKALNCQKHVNKQRKQPGLMLRGGKPHHGCDVPTWKDTTYREQQISLIAPSITQIILHK